MDPCCAFWPAGRRSIVRGAPSAPFTKSISPIDAKQTVSNERCEARIEEKGKGGEDEEKQKEDDKDEEGKKKDRVRREQPGASSQNYMKGSDDTTEGRRAAHPGEGQNPICAEIPEADIEVRKHRIANKPTLPTKAEIEEHFPLHLHYRNWCPHCVAGKARSNPY